MNRPLVEVTAAEIDAFRTFGYLVIRDAFDAERLVAEVDHALADGLNGHRQTSAEAGIGFAYLPMMCERTPISLALLDAFEPVAAQLSGGDVLPVRAKAVRYTGNATWHRDCDLALASVGFAAYLEALDAGSGALRVLPGSHHHDYGNAIATYLAAGGQPKPVEPDSPFAGVTLASQLGDVIVFDEHLFHASAGGSIRHQWRVDYLLRPTAKHAAEDFFADGHAFLPPYFRPIGTSATTSSAIPATGRTGINASAVITSTSNGSAPTRLQRHKKPARFVEPERRSDIARSQSVGGDGGFSDRSVDLDQYCVRDVGPASIRPARDWRWA